MTFHLQYIPASIHNDFNFYEEVSVLNHNNNFTGTVSKEFIWRETIPNNYCGNSSAMLTSRGFSFVA